MKRAQKGTLLRRIRMVSSASLLLSLVAMGVSGYALRGIAENLKGVVSTTEAIRNHMHGAMMHDALRGDVQAAMLARTTEEREAAVKDLEEHARLFSADLEANQKLSLPHPVQTALSAAGSELHAYIAAARAQAMAAQAGPEEYWSRMGDFQQRFEALESKNEALSEQIERSAHEAQAAAFDVVAKSAWALAGFAAALVFAGAATAAVMTRMVASLREKVAEVAGGVSHVAGMAAAIASSSQQVVAAAADQAASLTQTTQSSQRINDLAQANSSLSSNAAATVSSVQQRIVEADQQLEEMVRAIRGIEGSSKEISKINQMIESIAFQTNLLALNAAVEAARAGSAGAGFAVVADEVRALAQRCADAAKNTSGLIEESIRRTRDGAAQVTRVAATMHQVTEDAAEVRRLVEKVNAGSSDQSTGVAEVVSLIQSMAKLNQHSGATMEAAAKQAQRLRGESESLGVVAEELAQLSSAV